MHEIANELLVVALYRFVAFPDYADWQEPLLELCQENAVNGTLLLAPEGINATLSGAPAGIRAVLAYIERDERFAKLEAKYSKASAHPFQRMKVRLKKEIVSMGVCDIDPNRSVGTYVAPGDWNRLLEDPDVIVIDTRNDYEVEIGTFRGARNPHLNRFRDFPKWLKAEFSSRENPKVAMFCTGGIRCEKSTAFLKQQGLKEVYHLQGGILKYLETVPEEESLWEGECFVFDERVSVGQGLSAGTYDLCRACRVPISEADKQAPEYELGVSCSGCIDSSTPEQKASFRERARQVALAESRGQSHLKVSGGERPTSEAS